MPFQSEINEALLTGDSRQFFHRTPSADILQKIAQEAATWGLHVSVFRCYWVELKDDGSDGLLINTYENNETVEVVWHWPDETPEIDADGETEDNEQYWRNEEVPSEGVVFRSSTPQLISPT